MVRAISEKDGRFNLWDVDNDIILHNIGSDEVQRVMHRGEVIDGVSLMGDVPVLMYDCIDRLKSAKISFSYGCECLLADDGTCLHLSIGDAFEGDLGCISARFPSASVMLSSKAKSYLILSDNISMHADSFIGGMNGTFLDVQNVTNRNVLLTCMHAARTSNIFLVDRFDRRVFLDAFISLFPKSGNLHFFKRLGLNLPDGFDDWFIGQFDDSLVKGVSLNYADDCSETSWAVYFNSSDTLAGEKRILCDLWYNAILAPLVKGRWEVMTWLNYLISGGSSPRIKQAWDYFIRKAVTGDFAPYTYR